MTSQGDNIVITKKIDDNWYQGYLGDRKGIFPSSYVEVLDGMCHSVDDHMTDVRVLYGCLGLI